MKQVTSLIILVAVLILGVVLYGVCTETVGAGYEGFVYDRTAGKDDNVIEGTSVINNPRTGLIWLNPITQDVLKYPTTIVAKSWSRIEEGDNKNDMSMQVGSKEGKNIDADVYISVKASDTAKIIRSFGTKKFDSIIDNDIYGLVKGKLSIVTQKYSVYDIQASRSEIQEEAFSMLSQELVSTYGIELVRFEIGTLILPSDIQEKIDKKTQAQNEVELAKLEREKQDEINQQIVDQQKAQSEKELLQRQTEADAAAYEKQREAEAQLAVSEANVKIAEQELKIAELNKQAELEKQKAYTKEYFENKKLDVQQSAVEAINPSVKTIITSGDGEGYSGLVGVKEVLDSIGG